MPPRKQHTTQPNASLQTSTSMNSNSSLDSLPLELLGSIYKHLPDRESKKALLASCKHVRGALLTTLTTLTVTNEQLHQSATTNPLVCLPKGVQLRTLVIQGSRKREDTDSLRMLLQPQDGTRHGACTTRTQSMARATRDKAWPLLQGVKELELQDWFFGTYEHPLSELAHFLFQVPWNLEKLAFTGDRASCPAPFLVSLCSEPNAKQLKHLQVPPTLVDDENDQAIRSLTGLESFGRLSINLFGDATWLAELRQLQKLAMCELPPRFGLPSCLKELFIDEVQSPGLCSLIRSTNATTHPFLKRVEIKCLTLYDDPERISDREFSEWLCARPNFSFVCPTAHNPGYEQDGRLAPLHTCPATLLRGLHELSLADFEVLEGEELAIACPQIKRLHLCVCKDIRSVLGIFNYLKELQTISIGYIEYEEFPPGLKSYLLELCTEAAFASGTPNREVVLEFSTFVVEEGTEYSCVYRSTEEVEEIREAWEEMSLSLRERSVPCTVQLTMTSWDGDYY